MRIRRRRPALPPAPINVRVELADGRTVPVELVYTGLDGGLHVWEMTLPHVGAPIRRSGGEDQPGA